MFVRVCNIFILTFWYLNSCSYKNALIHNTILLKKTYAKSNLLCNTCMMNDNIISLYWNKLLETRCQSIILTFICINWVPGDPRSIFLVTSFTSKMPESSDSMYSSIFMLENIWYHYFNRSGPNSQEIVTFILNMGPGGPKLNWSKIHNFLWLRFTLGKIMISYDF